MKLRVRDKSGKTLPVDAKFVELLNDDGSVARVSYIRDDGSIVEFDQTDTHEAARYAKVMNVSFVPVKSLPGELFARPA